MPIAFLKYPVFYVKKIENGQNFKWIRMKGRNQELRMKD